MIFNRLSKSALREIVDVRLKEVQERIKDRRITLDVDVEARNWLSERGYDPAFGARPLNRVIQKSLLNPFARLLIDGGVRGGETAKVTVKTLENGETALDIQRNHEPGQIDSDTEFNEVAPIGDEEEILEEEYLKKKKKEEEQGK